MSRAGHRAACTTVLTVQTHPYCLILDHMPPPAAADAKLWLQLLTLPGLGPALALLTGLLLAQGTWVAWQLTLKQCECHAPEHAILAAGASRCTDRARHSATPSRSNASRRLPQGSSGATTAWRTPPTATAAPTRTSSSRTGCWWR